MINLFNSLEAQYGNQKHVPDKPKLDAEADYIDLLHHFILFINLLIPLIKFSKSNHDTID